MIPRALPRLVTDALRNGWSVSVDQNFKHMFAVAARFERPGEWVVITWNVEGDRPSLKWSEINGSPTPYTQCTRLIRSKEAS
ncbi:hypothetical protein [Brachybacterium sp. UMB0905]|uniref:hypothetical protein n=1 Tax=Brachybacterium sp. UMB0905 TaxID=2069310 RepID=UPI000C80DDDB|nr:hypothetical protein [Brachybacterium sp. UMB0905]PMC76379.1 hypothetical protein CJ197_04280 [Brachybacterium sp. UMB0905]